MIDDSYGGYVLYPSYNHDERYYFDKSRNNNEVAQYNLNTSRQELKTFGRVPYTYYGGNTNYHTIRLETVFVQGLCQDGKIMEKSSREQVDDFKRLVAKRVPLILENSQGEGYIVDVAIEREETPKNHIANDSLDFIVISIICTEIGKLYNNITIRHVGSGEGDTKILNDKEILGSGSGSTVGYEIVAKYNEPLTLESSPVSSDRFLGWYKDGIKITNPMGYLDFHDGEIIEARFSKVLTINIQHIGSGEGETSIEQNKQVIAESNGLKFYEANIVDSVPISLLHKIDEETTNFMGWKDIDGNKIDINNINIYNGLTIYAEFNIKTFGIVIIHKGANINSSVTQEGVLIDTQIGENISYIINARIDKNLVISHNSLDSSYVFQSIKDERGKTYSDVISPNDMRAGMILTILYKRSKASIIVNHIGGGSSQSTITQGANTLGSGIGEGTTYSVYPTLSETFMINTMADTHYELASIRDENGKIIQPILNPNQFYNGMVINIVFEVKHISPNTGGDSGSNDYHEKIYNLGSRSGRVNIEYSMGNAIPDKMEVWYHGVMVASTDSIEGNTVEQWKDTSGIIQTEGGFVTGVGVLSFDYVPIDFDYSLKIVVKPRLNSGNHWKYIVNPPI